MSTGKVLLGLVAGAAAGAVLGILFAPEKGSTTRQQISEKGEDILDSLKTKLDEFLSKATSEMEDAKSEAEDLLDKGKEKAQEVKFNVKNTPGSYQAGR